MTTHNESCDEQALIDGAKRGDREAMRRIYLLHARYLTAVCSRYVVCPEDVRDTLQDAFVDIYTHIATFQPRADASLRSWMTRVVVNKSLQFLRLHEKMQFIESVDDYADADVADERPDTDGVPYEQVRRMVGELPAGYRTVFNLYVFERRSHKEIARLLGIKEATSASQFHKAKRLLAAKLKQCKYHG